MANPHVCPKCNGNKKLSDGSPCPTCDASGVVWETTIHDVCVAGQRMNLIKGGPG